MSTIKNQTIHALKWDFTGTILVKGGGFVVSVILARLLTPVEFGVLGVAMVFIGFSSSLVDVGFSSAIVNRQKVSQLQLSTVFYINLILSIFLFFTFYVSSPYISGFFQINSLENIIKILACIFILNGLGQVQKSILTKNMRFDTITKISILALLFSGTSAIISSLYGLGIWALVIQQLTFAFFTNLLYWVFSSWKPSFLFSLSGVKDLFKYGINLFGATVINTLFLGVDKLIIGKLFSPVSLGLYSKSISMQNMFNTLFTTGLNVLFPAFSKMQDDTQRLKALFIKIFGLVSLITVFFSGFFWLVAKPMFNILLGDKWLLSSYYFQVLMVVGFVYPCSAIVVQTIKAVGRSDIFLKLDIYKKIIVMPSYLILYFFDITFFLWAMVIVNILSFILNILYLEKAIDIDLSVVSKVILTNFFITSAAVFVFSFLPVLNNDYYEILMVGGLYLLSMGSLLYYTQRVNIKAIMQILYDKCY